MPQYFKNTADPVDNRALDAAIYAKQNTQGVWEFWTHDPATGGIKMKMPTTLVPMSAAEIAAFTTPTLATAQANQNSILAGACKSAIEAGFTSSTLGAAHTYGSKPTDQANINAKAATGGGLWCATPDAAGNLVWAYVQHTLAQVQQVQKDMAGYIETQQTRYATRLASVAAATSVAAVQAVGW